jgi:hypothetical protein
MQRDIPMDNTQWIITLVHGTFASKATWTANDSLLCQRLTLAHPNIKFTRFIWSGANSALSRTEAVISLRKQLEESVAQNATAQHVVISHSHGGNIAMSAAASVPGVRVVCLSTPFIVIQERSNSSTLWTMSGLAVGLIFLIIYLVSSILHGLQGLLIMFIMLWALAGIAKIVSRPLDNKLDHLNKWVEDPPASE